MKIKTTKTAPGMYEVSDGDRTVYVTFESPKHGSNFTGWMARASWDRYLYSDPLPTKRAAVQDATFFILDATAEA